MMRALQYFQTEFQVPSTSPGCSPVKNKTKQKQKKKQLNTTRLEKNYGEVICSILADNIENLGLLKNLLLKVICKIKRILVLLFASYH